MVITRVVQSLVSSISVYEPTHHSPCPAVHHLGCPEPRLEEYQHIKYHRDTITCRGEHKDTEVSPMRVSILTVVVVALVVGWECCLEHLHTFSFLCKVSAYLLEIRQQILCYNYFIQLSSIVSGNVLSSLAPTRSSVESFQQDVHRITSSLPIHTRRKCVTGGPFPGQ